MANTIRGETTVRLSGNPSRDVLPARVVLAATMDDLARFSQQTGCQTLDEMFKRLTHVELAATRVALSLFTVKTYVPDPDKGENAERAIVNRQDAVRAALAAHSLSDTDALSEAFSALMETFVVRRERKPGEDDEPNPQTAGSV